MVKSEQDKPFIAKTGIKGGRGPKPRFTIRLVDKICQCVRYGLSNTEIAYLLDFHEDMITRWLKSSDVFRTKFDQALNHVEEVMVNALYLRANGMKVTERIVKQTTLKGAVGADGIRSVDVLLKTEKTVCERELPPDAISIKFLLSNRQSEEWQENPTDRLQDKARIDFDSIEFSRPTITISRYPDRAKAICDAVRKVIGIEAESDVSLKSIPANGFLENSFGLDEMTVTEDVQLAVA